MRRDHEITALLRRIDAGEREAWENLMGLVYGQLRLLAGHLMQSERPDHTWQPTELVHEALLRLMRQERFGCKDRKQFFGLVVRAMERTLIDHAREHAAKKRNAGRKTVFVNPEDEDGTRGPSAQAKSMSSILDITEALGKLEELGSIHGARKAEVVRLHYLVGLTGREIAQILEISPRTVKRDLRFSKVWLADRLLS